MASSTDNDLQGKSEPSLERPAKPLTESASTESSVSEEILQEPPERYSIGLTQGQKAAFIKWAKPVAMQTVFGHLVFNILAHRIAWK